MSESLDTEPHTQPATPEIIGPGARLRKIRQAKTMSLQDISTQICLPEARLLQIEADDYHTMGSPAFAKGYLRAYAGTLSLDEKDISALIKSFDDLCLGQSIKHSAPKLMEKKITDLHSSIAKRAGQAGLVILVLLLAYLYSQHFLMLPTASVGNMGARTTQTSGATEITPYQQSADSESNA